MTDTTVWTVLKPELTSKSGTSLTLQDDGSILPSGKNPRSEKYTAVSDVPLNDINALRLEVLPHTDIQHGATGRGPLGHFTLTEVTASLAAVDDAAQEEAMEFSSATASYERTDQKGNNILTTIDGQGDNDKFWNTWPQTRLPATAIFEFLTPTVDRKSFRLTVNLDFHHERFPQHNLGRFRLSVTDDPAAFESNDRRFTVSRIEDPWARMAAAFYVTGDEPALDALLHRKPHADMGIAIAADWSESIAWLDRVMNAGPGNAEARARLLQLRGAIHVRGGQWGRAATDYAESVELDPAADSVAWMLPAALWAYADNDEQHREWTRKLAERFRGSAEVPDSERTVKVMLLMDKGLDAELAPVEPVLAALAGDALTQEYRSWFTAVRALLACRSAEFAAAQRDVDQSLQLAAGESRGSIRVLFALGVQALIHAKQGNMTAAQATVDELKTLLADAQGLKWRNDGSLDGSTIVNNARVDHDLLIPEILRREAERLIQEAALSREQPAGDGKPQP